jgi:hypothetical protein
MHSQSMAEPGNTSHSCGLSSYAVSAYLPRASHNQALSLSPSTIKSSRTGTMSAEQFP